MGLYDAVRIASALTQSAGSPQPDPPASNVLEDLPDGAELTAEEVEPDGRLAAVLDETSDFISGHVAAPETYAHAMTLIAAQTYVLPELVTTMRVLVHSDEPASGKTSVLNVLASLCQNACDATGSSYALTSRLAGAGQEGIPCPTLYYDELRIFGPGGTRNPSGVIPDILRKGYKRTATSSWSVDRSPVDFSTYSTFIVTGLQTAVPADVRSRCIAFEMHPGKPREYFDVRNAESEAKALASALGAAVKAHKDGIRAFRARGIHPKLEGRRLEIWEGVFAVAAMAGQEWLNRAHTCFCELALDETDQPILTPRQMVIRDLAQVLPGMTLLKGGFVGGRSLVDELKRMDDRPQYDGRSDIQLGRLISDSLPFRSEQRRFGTGDNVVKVRGYLADAILEAWDAIKPDDIGDVLVPGESDPFEVTDE
jgi:hypothetical protein